jgi:hypothetical protein
MAIILKHSSGFALRLVSLLMPEKHQEEPELIA